MKHKPLRLLVVRGTHKMYQKPGIIMKMWWKNHPLVSSRSKSSVERELYIIGSHPILPPTGSFICRRKPEPQGKPALSKGVSCQSEGEPVYATLERRRPAFYYLSPDHPFKYEERFRTRIEPGTSEVYVGACPYPLCHADSRSWWPHLV
jgi:hypothetical protein